MSEKLYKDVIMIIKGWYNEEKYNCSFAAWIIVYLSRILCNMTLDKRKIVYGRWV